MQLIANDIIACRLRLEWKAYTSEATLGQPAIEVALEHQDEFIEVGCVFIHLSA